LLFGVEAGMAAPVRAEAVPDAKTFGIEAVRIRVAVGAELR